MSDLRAGDDVDSEFLGTTHVMSKQFVIRRCFVFTQFAGVLITIDLMFPPKMRNSVPPREDSNSALWALIKLIDTRRQLCITSCKDILLEPASRYI